MTKLKAIAGADKWGYDEVRCYLVLNAAGYRQVINDLRVKHHLTKLSKIKRVQRINFEEVFPAELYKDTIKLAALVRVPQLFVEQSLIGPIAESRLRDLSAPILIGNGQPAPEGFYIRVDPYTTVHSVDSAFKWIKNEYLALASVAEPNPKHPRLLSHYRKPSELGLWLSAYKLIEESVYDQHLAKLMKGSGGYVESEGGLVDAAIELASEELIRHNLKNGDKLMVTKLVKRNYYQLLRSFSVPSTREYLKFKISGSVSQTK